MSDSFTHFFPSYDQMERLIAAQNKIAGMSGTGDLSQLETVISANIVAGRTGKVWKRKVYFYSVNSTSQCPALNENDEGAAVPFTDTAIGKDPYMDNFRVFQWQHCNYVRDSDSTARVTALEGYPGYKTSGNVDVGTLLPTFYWNWEKKSDHFLLTFSDSPHPELGLIPWVYAIKLDGTVLPYFIVSSYQSSLGDDGLLRSLPGRQPAFNQSYDSMIIDYQKKGEGYWGAGSDVNTLAYIYLIVKYLTKNSKNIFKGNALSNDSVQVAHAESNTKRILVSAVGQFTPGCTISLGSANADRNVGTSHDILNRKLVKSIEEVTVGSTAYTALNIDTDTAFNTATTNYVKIFPCISGQTDAVLGHYDGSVLSNTDSHHSLRIEGIEMMNGQFITASDTVIKFLSSFWQVYKAPKGTKHVKDSISGMNLIGESKAFTGDSYVGNIDIDISSGGYFHLEKATGSAVGTGDNHYNGGTPADGTLREWQALGALHNGAAAGFCCVFGGAGLSGANCHYGSRD